MNLTGAPWFRGADGAPRTALIGGVRLRLLLTPPLPGPLNMALDDALLARARESGEVHLRSYAWERPTLSLGRNQKAVGLYDRSGSPGAGSTWCAAPPAGGPSCTGARSPTA
jgi:hypothetical protein